MSAIPRQKYRKPVETVYLQFLEKSDRFYGLGWLLERSTDDRDKCGWFKVTRATARAKTKIGWRPNRYPPGSILESILGGSWAKIFFLKVWLKPVGFNAGMVTILDYTRWRMKGDAKQERREIENTGNRLKIGWRLNSNPSHPNPNPNPNPNPSPTKLFETPKSPSSLQLVYPP